MIFLKKYFQNRKGLQKFGTKHVPHSPNETKFQNVMVWIFLAFKVWWYGYSLHFLFSLLFSHLGSVAHVSYAIFEALFDFGNIFSKKSFFDPLNPPFLKKLKILTFFENPLWGHVAHVDYGNIFFRSVLGCMYVTKFPSWARRAQTSLSPKG